MMKEMVEEKDGLRKISVPKNNGMNLTKIECSKCNELLMMYVDDYLLWIDECKHFEYYTIPIDMFKATKHIKFYKAFGDVVYVIMEK